MAAIPFHAWEIDFCLLIRDLAAQSRATAQALSQASPCYKFLGELCFYSALLAYPDPHHHDVFFTAGALQIKHMHIQKNSDGGAICGICGPEGNL